MKTSDKQLLRVFVVLTITPLLVAGVGSLMNFLISCVFMCPFVEIQLSGIWVFHMLFGIFFATMLLSD